MRKMIVVAIALSAGLVWFTSRTPPKKLIYTLAEVNELIPTPTPAASEPSGPSDRRGPICTIYWDHGPVRPSFNSYHCVDMMVGPARGGAVVVMHKYMSDDEFLRHRQAVFAKSRADLHKAIRNQERERAAAKRATACCGGPTK